MPIAGLYKGGKFGLSAFFEFVQIRGEEEQGKKRSREKVEEERIEEGCASVESRLVLRKPFP